MNSAAKYTVTRTIELDAAHRVSTHGSKCFNLHGHRYKVEATCEADVLHQEGEQSGMVLDFGFLKKEMMRYIHDTCDHTMIWYLHDTLISNMLGLNNSELFRQLRDTFAEVPTGEKAGFVYRCNVGPDVIDTVVTNFIPTAENLAEFWYNAIVDGVDAQSQGIARLVEVRVHETPNGVATFRPSIGDS